MSITQCSRHKVATTKKQKKFPELKQQLEGAFTVQSQINASHTERQSAQFPEKHKSKRSSSPNAYDPVNKAPIAWFPAFIPAVIALVSLDNEELKMDSYAANRAKADAVAQTKEDLGPVTCRCFIHLTYSSHSYRGRGEASRSYTCKDSTRLLDNYFTKWE